MVAMQGTEGNAPVAALLFEPADRPDADAVAALTANAVFDVLDSRRPAGCIELLREGLTFDLVGLAPAAAVAPVKAAHVVALPQTFAESGLEALFLSAGPHLAHAEHLLPVVRCTAALLLELAGLPGVKAIEWLPARQVMSPEWFAEAVGAWLDGGPFPVLALTALSRSGQAFYSDGLGFLIGQEFTLYGKDGQLSPTDSRVAVRLTDWLVAHGKVEVAREVVLAGVGPVWLEPDPAGRIAARCL